MMSPNSIYSDTSLYDGLPVGSGDFIKIFCDIEKTVKIKRSMIKIEIDSKVSYYTLTDPKLILRINGTAVTLRLTRMDLSKAYLFTLDTDVFLGIVDKNIPVYGDRKSMSKDDKKSIFIHSRRIKAISKECNERKGEVDEHTQDEITLNIFDPSIKRLK